MTERCSRHPDREGVYGVAFHYLEPDAWRHTIQAEQTFGPLCPDCRYEFISWVTHRADKADDPAITTWEDEGGRV